LTGGPGLGRLPDNASDIITDRNYGGLETRRIIP
jgi:hypothetical protein